MLNNVRKKIIVPVAAILILLVAAVVVFVLISVNNLTSDMTYERIEGASASAYERLEAFEEQTRLTAISVASSYTVAANLLDWNASEEKRPQARQNLITYLTASAAEMGVDSFVVRDHEGRIILRLHDLDTYYDIDGSPAGLAALEGRTTTSYSSTPTMPMGLNTTTPIRHEGQIIGTMTPLFFLHTDEFVDHFADIFNAEITIFGGSTRVATTILDEVGNRVIGTDIEGPVVQTVLEQGHNYLTQLELFGAPYYAYYFPLNGFAGNPVGMFFVGFSTQLAATATNTLLITLIIIGVVGLALALLIVLRVAGNISKPLKSVAGFMTRASSTGDLTLTDDQKNDIQKYSQNKCEIGEMYRGTSSFVMHIIAMSEEVTRMSNSDFGENVKELSDDDVIGTALNRMTNNLNSIFSEINMASAQVAAGSKQVADGSQALAQGSTEQAASVQQLSASIIEIADKTKNNADMAEKAAMLANDIKGAAEKGTGQMDEMMSAVKDINASSQNISKVIKSIDDIAFQTNILALNAAVEAARAGQHGKGFAVVAEEVRNLAAKSAEAAKDTESLIADSIEKAELGSRIADDTAASLEEIVNGIGESSALVAEIAKSSEEQAVGISQINHGIDQVAQVTQQNSATAEQSAAASEEMSGQSSMLEELISRFKLKDDRGFGRKSLPHAAAQELYAGASEAQPSEIDFGKY